jgi:phosphate transport system substrate-binding protein
MVILTMCFIASAGSAWAVKIKIGAGTAVSEGIFKKIQVPMEQATGDTILLMETDPVQAFKDMDAGVVDAAVGGYVFVDWMSMMEKEGYPVPKKDLYKSYIIGKDVIRVLTNKDVTVKALSKEQLVALFTGKIKDWSKVGGPNLPVVVVLGSKIPGTQAVFQKAVMAGAPYLKEAVEGTTAEDVKNRVIATPGAISLGVVAQIDATINAPTIPVVGRPIIMIVRRDLIPFKQQILQRMMDFIEGPGKELLAHPQAHAK